jgi:hypothetical protein
MKNMSGWNFFIILFGLERMVFRIKLIWWLIKCIPLVFRGCEEYPVPIDLYQRICWYTTRFLKLFDLYKWMMDHQKKKGE